MDPPLALSILVRGPACSREGQGAQQIRNQLIKNPKWLSDLRSLNVGELGVLGVLGGDVQPLRYILTSFRGCAGSVVHAHVTPPHTHTHT